MRGSAIPTLAIRRGAVFIATNTDRTLPTEQGLIPGAGSLVGMLEISDRRAGTCHRQAISRHHAPGVGAARNPRPLTAAVGDRPETDIAGGQAAGAAHHWRAHGREPAKAFGAMQPPPDWVFEDIVALRQKYLGGA